MSARPYVTETAHESFELAACPGARSICLKPFAKGCIQRFVLSLSYQAGLFDQMLISTESDILHTNLVYTISVYLQASTKTPFRHCYPAAKNLLRCVF